MKFINLIKKSTNENPSDNIMLGQREENHGNRTFTGNSTASELIAKLNRSIEKQQDYQPNITKSYKTFQNDDLTINKSYVAYRIEELNRASINNHDPESASARIAAINARLTTKNK